MRVMDLGAIRLQDLTRQQLREARSLDFCKWLACFAQTRDRQIASEWYLEKFPKTYGASLVRKELALLQSDDIAMIRRATSPVASTTDPAYAGALVGISQLEAGFIEIVYSASLLGRIPGARRSPFNCKVPVQDAGAAYAWVGEGAPKPVSQQIYNDGTTLTRTKAATILTFTHEYLRAISDATAAGMQRVLVNGLTNFTDTQLLSTSPATPASPAGILNGVVGVPSGSTGLQDDLLALFADFFSKRPAASSVSIIASPAKAVQIAAATNWSSSGVGVPILTSAAAADNIIVLDGDGLVFADDGIEIDVAREASVQMVDNPGTPDATTVFRSLWQDNQVGLKSERFVNWFAAPTSVAFLLPPTP